MSSGSDVPPPRSPSGGRLQARLGARSGTTLGRYELVRRIGRGGMAEVYEAVHRGLKKSVAIKVLLPEIAESDDLRARFLREGEAAAHIRHPHVVDVTDVGEEDGVPYLVMELLEGQPLSQRIAMGPLSIVETLDVLLPIGAALSEAHRRGVLHRDLKPENVFIARSRGGRSVPKLLDFGVSKLARAERSHTAAAAVLGTPDYMAPEQALGATDVDDRADQYSFALMIYECLTGRLPFESQNVVALLHEVARGVSRPPSSFTPDVPPEVDDAVLRALSADPEARYPGVSELLAELLPFASARASLAYRTLLGERSDFSGKLREPAPSPRARAAAPTQDISPIVGTSSPVASPEASPEASPVASPIAGATGEPLVEPITGPITGPITASLVEPITGPITAPLVGPITGPITGANPGAIPGPITGPITGPLVEPITGPITGPITEPLEKARGGVRTRALLGAVALVALALAAWTVLVPGPDEDVAIERSRPIEPPPTAPSEASASSSPLPASDPAPHEDRPELMRVVVVATPPSASIELDGDTVVIGALDVELPRDGRTHTLTVRAPGYRPRTSTFVDRAPPLRVTLERLGVGSRTTEAMPDDDDIRTQR